LPYLPILSLIIGAAGCADAPHDNALDPLSPSFKNSGVLSGLVTVRNQSAGIPGATVTILDQGIFQKTDDNGRFSFSQVGAGSLTLACSKDGFVPDTQRIRIDPGAASEASFSLNGIPVVSDPSIITHKVDQYYPSPQYFVQISASVTDPNGIADIDTVWFSVDTLAYPMTYSISSRHFETTIYKYDFPTNSIQWLVGRSLLIRSRDHLGAVGTSPAFHVTRIIEDAATPTYPTSIHSDTTGSQPLLQWAPSSATFNYSYTLEMARDDAGNETTVWVKAGVNSFFSQFQFTVDDAGGQLLPGNYVWRISVVDDFGNSARSKGAFFTVR